jgi:hypothetical protein
MTRTAKLVILVVCVSLCGGGAILSSKGKTENVRPRPNAVPIHNRQPQPGVWIWA